MRTIPDRWNPRLRLRNWLLKPSAAEAAAATYRARAPVSISEYHLATQQDSAGRTFVAGCSGDIGPFVLGADGVSFLPIRPGDEPR